MAGVVVFVVSAGYQSQKMVLFPFYVPFGGDLDHGRRMGQDGPVELELGSSPVCFLLTDLAGKQRV